MTLERKALDTILELNNNDISHKEEIKISTNLQICIRKVRMNKNEQ